MPPTFIPPLCRERIPYASEWTVLASMDRLSDQWRVYHGLPYSVRASGSQPAREGDVDVLVLHPDHGMLALEVKGGGVSYDGRSGAWWSKSERGVLNPIHDPFAQASWNLHHVKGLIERYRPFDGDGTVDFVHGHGVVFPDVFYEPQAPPPNGPRELVLDAKDLDPGRMEEALLGLFEFWSRNRPELQPLGKRRVKQLARNLFASHFGLVTTRGVEMAWDERTLVQLSGDQRTCLDFLDLNPRAMVQGGAGSGKTIVAVERARQLAVEGKRVLLLCFNTLLAADLRERCSDVRCDPGSITVRRFHELCRESWEMAGETWTDEPPAETLPSVARTFWDEETARRLFDAIGRVPGRFDALVVDEGQDFLSSWWTTLHYLLPEPERSPYAIFSDPSQDVFGRDGRFGLPMPVFPLTAGHRSTRSIADFAASLIGVPARHAPGVPDGEVPKVVRWKTRDDHRSAVETVLAQLLGPDGVSASDVTLVGTHTLRRSFLADRPELCGRPVVAIETENRVPKGALRYATPGKFKGLESAVVLLLEVDDHPKRCSPQNLYTAASRARLRLWVFVQQGVSLPGGGAESS